MSSNILLDDSDTNWQYISSPSYPADYGNNARSIWNIIAPNNTGIQFEVVFMDIELVYDYLSIYDGISSQQPAVQWSGSLNSTLLTRENSAAVEFISDDSVTGNGFELRFNVVHYVRGFFESLQILTGDEGIVMSPDYPSVIYVNSTSTLTYQWLIQVDSDKVIDVDIIRYYSPYGRYPITFYDGSTTSDQALITTNYIQYTYITSTFTSTQNEMLVIINGTGYDTLALVFSYKSVDYGDRFCNGQTSYIDSVYGEITSPSYPRAYPGSSNCRWLITSPTSTGIVGVIIEYYRVLSSDSTIFYDGNSTSDSVLRTCGGSHYCSTGYVTTSSGSEMLITFLSAAGSSYYGFKLRYSSTVVANGTCAQLIQTNTDGNSGYAFSPYYPLDYPYNYYCEYNINVTTGVVNYDFVDFQTESCCDHLYIYDGNTTSSPLLVYLSGSHVGYSGSSSGNSLTMVFQTDGSITNTGFMMSYSADSTPPSPAIVGKYGNSYITIQNTIDSFYQISPSYSTAYSNNADYIWYIENPYAENYIVLSFYRIEIDDSDFVKIYNGIGTDNSDFMFTLTGNYYYSSRTMYANNATIWLHTDAMFSGKGFILRYYVSSP